MGWEKMRLRRDRVRVRAKDAQKNTGAIILDSSTFWILFFVSPFTILAPPTLLFFMTTNANGVARVSHGYILAVAER